MKNAVTIRLPFPPSVNHYWSHRVAGKPPKQFVQTYISKKGRQYREHAVEAVRRVFGKPAALSMRLDVKLVLFPPDRRARDLDNYNKAALDALTHANVWQDDSLIDRLVCERGEVSKQAACVEVTIQLADSEQLQTQTTDEPVAPF